MSPEPAGAVDCLGAPVATPVYIEPKAWRRITRRVVMIPGGCHLWTGPPRDDGYAQVSASPSVIRPADPNGPGLFPAEDVAAGPREPDRIWRAHRLTYAALTGVILDEEQHLMHQCDEPMCAPITVEQLAAHITLGDNVANVSERESRGRGVRRGRYGLPIPTRADRRGQAAHSRALFEAIRDALAAGAKRDDLPAVVASVADAGDPMKDQPTLF